MKKKLLESSILFVSVVKWIFLAALTGIVVGFSTAIFIKSLEAGIGFAKRFDYYFLLLPLAMLLSTLLVKYLAPEAVGHGTEKVIEAVHKKSGRIDLFVVPVKLIATVVTISSGGSAGKEGPAAQIGAGLCSTLATVFKFGDKDRKKLVICGISAGFATVFGTPIAGAIFGVEVLFVGGLLYEVLLPSFVAGIVGYQVSSSLGVTYFYEPLNFVPVFSSGFFIKICLAGIFFGLCSMLFIETFKAFEEFKKRFRWFIGPIVGGLMLVGLTLISSKTYLGLGLDTIKSAIEGERIPYLAPFLKILFTSITLSLGGSGGIITPIFFVGATSGSIFASLFGYEPSVFSAVGLVSLLAGAANTPISAGIMAVELFGPQVAPYAAVAGVISFLMTGHRSVYPSQVLYVKKSGSLQVPEGEELRKVSSVSFSPREKSITGKIAKAIDRLKRK